jgi:Mannose-6-phosphate isomerase
MLALSVFFKNGAGALAEPHVFAHFCETKPMCASKILLELIEVQTGSYFGEDDIIRIEDDYRRE